MPYGQVWLPFVGLPLEDNFADIFRESFVQRPIQNHMAHCDLANGWLPSGLEIDSQRHARHCGNH
jgi:hypothetical protein